MVYFITCSIFEIFFIDEKHITFKINYYLLSIIFLFVFFMSEKHYKNVVVFKLLYCSQHVINKYITDNYTFINLKICINGCI